MGSLSEPFCIGALAAHRPAYAAALSEVWQAVWEQDAVDETVLECCRLRIGQLCGSDVIAERVPDAWVTALPDWPSDPRFDGSLRVALEFAEQLAMDAQGVNDAQAAEVVDAFGEAGFLVLTYACGLFETTARADTMVRRLLTGREGGAS